MKNFNFFIALLFLGSLAAQAQESCGAKLSEAQRTWLKAHQQNQHVDYKAADGITYLPIQIHILGTDEGSGYFSAKNTYRMLCKLNDDFWNSPFQFYSYETFHYINRSSWFNHEEFGPGFQMMNSNNVKDVINVYMTQNPAGNCGYFSPSADGIVMNNSCAGAQASTLAHELGHYFSLPHTFRGWEDGEPQEWRIEKMLRKDGNCETAGDGFCDTPADYVAERWACPYNTELEDPNGIALEIDQTLFMNYAFDGCVNRFSPMQMTAMEQYVQQARSDLLIHSPAINNEISKEALSRPQPLYPLDAAAQTYPAEGAKFFWTPVDGAKSYHFELTSPDDQNLHLDLFPSENFLELDLVDGQRYAWSISAIGVGNYCANYSAVQRFTAGGTSSLRITSIESSNPTCYGAMGDDGMISASFNDGGTAELTGLRAGTHELSYGGQIFKITLENPDPIAVNIEQLKNGELFARTIRGGQPPYDILWDNGSTDRNVTGLSGGIHSFTVTDANGCVQTEQINVIVPNIQVNSISCNGAQDGSIELIEVVGGFPSQDIVLKHNYDRLENWENLGEGKYVFTVAISAQEWVEFDYSIAEPETLVAELYLNPDNAIVDISGGIEPYLVVWSNGVSNNNASGVLALGEHQVYIEDANGCSLTRTFSILASGIEDAEALGVVLYPNPTSEGVVSIDFPNDLEFEELLVFNAQGKSEIRSSIQSPQSNGQISLDVSSLQMGIYFVEMRGADFSTVLKLAIQ